MSTALIIFNMALILWKDQPSEALKYANDAFKIFNQIGHTQYASRVQALIDKIKGA